MNEEEVIAELEEVYESLDILDRDTALSNKAWILYATYYTAKKRELEQQLAEVRAGQKPSECDKLWEGDTGE